MPQYFDNYRVREYFEWMNRTVKSWHVDLEELYAAPDDPNLFWAVGTYEGDVFWGNHHGRFTSKFIKKIRLYDSKIVHVKMMLDPLAYLNAAGRTCPVFRMDIHHPDVDRFMEESKPEHPEAPSPPPAGPDSASQRIIDNLDAFRNGDYWKSVYTIADYADDAQMHVWFLPPEMDHEYPPELMPRVHAWSELSCTNIMFDYNGVAYPTEDPQVYFAEYRCSGDTNWLGNECSGRYRNEYFYILRFNENGQIRVCEEFLNPVNKFNSINVSLPSFPYYF